MSNLNSNPKLGMEQPHPFDRSKIPGWGVDLSAFRRPGVPRELEPEETGAHWDEPEQQESDVRVFYSIERPMITPVFGTTCPPRLLSGKIREKAYQLGEDRKRRWLLLLFADRVDVWEHRIEEFFLGRRNENLKRVPNPLNWLLSAGLIFGGVALCRKLKRPAEDLPKLKRKPKKKQRLSERLDVAALSRIGRPHLAGGVVH